jgi:uncharacterized membrane protein
VAGCCDHSDETSGSGAMELASENLCRGAVDEEESRLFIKQ